MGKPRILFITPAATRSGAPMLCLHLIRWMREHTDFEMAAVLTTGGAMAAEFEAVLPTCIFERDAATRSAILKSLSRRAPVSQVLNGVRAKRCRKLIGNWPPDLVFCNSAGAAGVLDAMGPYRCPVIVGVHELRFALQSISWVPGGAVAAMKRNATHYLAGSRSVAAHLIEQHDIAAAAVTVVHDFIPTAEFEPRSPGSVRSSGEDLRSAAGVPANAAVLGCIATVEWRKGADLLVPLARLLPKTDGLGRPIHLIWVGGGQPADVLQLKFDIATADVGDRVHAVGPTGRTADWYPAFTVLAMLSREDPFPLVASEAAASGVPIVCFEHSGGVPELVEDDAGRIVPFLDLRAFAAAVTDLFDQPALLEKLGQRAAQKVRERHDVSVAVPQVVDCIRAQINARPNGPARS